MTDSFSPRTPTLLVLLIAGVGTLSAIILATSDPAALLPGDPSQTGDGQSEASSKDTQSQTETADDIEIVGPPPKSPPIWEAWDKPQLALILTGEQHGYFEPCGCTSNQLGGMSRRADLVTKLQAAGWEVRGLDVGGLARRTSQQAGIKLDTTLKALHQLRYLAVGVGPEELRLGVDKLLEVHMNMSNLDATVPFVSANLAFLEGALEGFPEASRIMEIGNLKIGVTSVFSHRLKAEVGSIAETTWKEPGPEIERVLTSFDEQQVDYRVLLSQATFEESKAFAEQYPAFDLILTARGVSDPNPAAPPTTIGGTLVVEAGTKGKYTGVIGLYPGSEPAFRYSLVSLEREDFDDTPGMIRLMEEYQQQLKDFQIAKIDVVSSPHPSGATFVGADACGECHTEAYKIWKDTPHAHAFESLNPVHQRKGFERLNGVLRTFDPECLACHVTGWDPVEYIRFRSGFLNEEFAETSEETQLHSLFLGSQCENCHGPGSKHIELVNEGADNAGNSVRVTLQQAKKSMCTRCHDGDNSPEFAFETYWPQVEHYGLD